jgi:hypothetical protein
LLAIVNAFARAMLGLERVLVTALADKPNVPQPHLPAPDADGSVHDMHENMPIDRLELSVAAMDVLSEHNVASVADLLALDVSGWSARIVAEIREGLRELDIVWDVAVPARAPFTPPPERAVACSSITYTHATGSAPVSRLGGAPNAPTADTAWPSGMKFLFQLTGPDLGLDGVTLVQAFADMTGEYYEANCQAIRIYREPCPHVLQAPAGIVADPARIITLTPNLDDSILADIDIYDDDALEAAGVDQSYVEEARHHAWRDKIRGVPIGANIDRDQRDSKGQTMTSLLQLVTYDDAFLWYLFANADASELRLEVVRG